MTNPNDARPVSARIVAVGSDLDDERVYAVEIYRGDERVNVVERHGWALKWLWKWLGLGPETLHAQMLTGAWIKRRAA